VGSLRSLQRLLESLADSEHNLFSLSDMRPVFEDLSPEALKMMLTRAVADGLLERVCRGLYLYPMAPLPRGMLLYYAAAKLRAYTFNYISLESALSDMGVISQIPINWLTLMTGGRSALISCGKWGTIEFIHTARKAEDLASLVAWDPQCRLWRASPSLALEDLKRCRRSLDLVDWSVMNEFV